MGRPAAYSAQEKLRIVLAVLAGKTTTAQAAREYQVSRTAVNNWKRQFVEAGLTGLAQGETPHRAPRLAQLAAQNDTLKTALREAQVLAQVWQISAQHRQHERDQQP